jgi:hypothetical protein
MSLRLRHLATAAAAVLIAGPAAAANLLTNGDFEAGGGSLNGWTVTLNGAAQLGALTAADYHTCCFTVGTEPAYSDNHFAEFDDGNVTGLAVLSQMFNTIAGAHYTLSFRAGAFGSGHNMLFVGAPGVSDSILLTANNNADNTFATYTYGFTGTGAQGGVAFGVNATERDNTDAILDDVSVTRTGGVPEPAAWALMLLGFGTAGAALRRRRNAFA